MLESPSSSSGVLCDGNGHICALYARAFLLGEENESTPQGYGIPVRCLRPLLEHLVGTPQSLSFTVPSIEVELQSVPLAKLRRLPGKLRPAQAWFNRISHASACSSALQITGVSSTGVLASVAQLGDLLVAVCSKVVASAFDVEAELQATAAATAAGEQPVVSLTLLRGGREVAVRAAVTLLGNDGARRVLCWHGLILQDLPRGLRWLEAVPQGVHIVDTMLGSPAEAHGIEGEVLVSVDGVLTRSLDDVARISSSCNDKASCCRHMRIETADTSGRRFLKTLEPDPLFWPPSEVKQDCAGIWHFQES